MEKQITLGEQYMDTLAKFTGVAYARTEYASGCVRVCLVGPGKDGAAPVEHWCDEQLLEGVAGPKKGGGSDPPARQGG